MLFLLMRTIVNALLLKERSVLLVRRSHQRKAYPGLWSFPGGHVEENETMMETLTRELREEIAVVPTNYAYLTAISDAYSCASDPATYYIYCVRAWDGEPSLTGNEHTELSWFALEKAAALPDLALDQYRFLFRKLADA
jgi:8-oxo-dGTP diphosphatase